MRGILADLPSIRGNHRCLKSESKKAWVGRSDHDHDCNHFMRADFAIASKLDSDHQSH